jgi:hypothetical protein
MTDEQTARALARWLEQPPGTDPPAELGREVVEAIYALRPDLAPTPRLTADDILATVTKGPLADSTATPSSVGSREGAEVVAFPGDRVEQPTGESDPAIATRRSRRVWLWVGGTGGVGLALAAAATLALVALPGLRPERAEEAPVATGLPASGEVAAPRPAAELQKEVDAAKMGNQVAAPSEPAASPAPPPATVARTRAEEGVPMDDLRENEVRDMVGLGGVASPPAAADEGTIPELEAAVASESNTAGPPVAAAQAASGAKGEAKQKADEGYADAKTTVDEDTVARIEDAVKRSE